MPITYHPTPTYNQLVKAGEVDPNESDMHAAWPEFMRHDPIADTAFGHLYEQFAALQTYAVEDGRLIAKIECVPVRWDGDPASLPTAGWRWALTTGTANAENGIQPNTLCAIAIAIAPSCRGRGLSTVFLGKMAEVGRSLGYRHLIAPVRPSQKVMYPLIPMADYITWKRADGLPFDAWLRVHVRAGGEIVGVTDNALEIHGTRSDWESWTDLTFYSSGDYIVPGALNPAHADLNADAIIYREPNVWVIHTL